MKLGIGPLILALGGRGLTDIIDPVVMRSPKPD